MLFVWENLDRQTDRQTDRQSSLMSISFDAKNIYSTISTVELYSK